MDSWQVVQEGKHAVRNYCERMKHLASLAFMARYQALAGGSEPLQSYLHKRLAENLNSETALGTVCDVAQCVQWLRSTFLYVRAAKDPKRYLGLTSTAPDHLILKKIEELCVRAMNGLASAGLISMDEASCIESTEAGRLMSVFFLDLETMKLIMKIQGNESLERLLWIICECHELAEMHLRTDERRTLNTLNRNNAAATIRFPMKGKISTRQMKLNCIIQAVLGCLPIPDPSLNQEAMKIMRIADRVCKCLVAYVTRPEPVTQQLQYFSAVLNTIILAKCIAAHLWENSPYVSKQLKGIGPTFSTLLATAGKVNFMLLEESHPRDLERIMNKGAPAGNVLRKQISLLPKYHLEATPVDERTVSVKLLLLNQAHLSENMDTLTAGPTHKCYVIAGDSENHLLLLTSFVDKDLIRVYDGTMNYEIKRKHSFEHKITVHCVSSSFVGIDTQCEYTFTDLMPAGPYNESVDTSSHFFEGKTKTIPSKPTNVVMPKERKRKSNSDDISQSKEKKKRDNALAEKFKLLKESFGRTSTDLKKDLHKTEEMTRNVLNDLGYPEQSTRKLTEENSQHTILSDQNISETNVDIRFPDYDDDIMDDAKIDSILSEIETEITKVNNESKTRMIDNDEKNLGPIGNSTYFLNKSNSTVKQNQPRKRPTRHGNTKNNFEFLALVEKNTDFDEDVEDVPVKETGFSDAIKFQVENFIQKSHNVVPLVDLTLCDVYEHPKYMKNSHNVNFSCYHENNLLGDTIKEKDNKNEELQNHNSNQTHNLSESNNNEDSNCFVEEELPEVNIKGPFGNLVPQTNNFESQHKCRETYEKSDTVNIGTHSINNSFIESRSQPIIPNEMITTNNTISYDPKAKGSNDMNEIAHLSNDDDNMSKKSENTSNPQILQSLLVPISKKPAFVSNDRTPKNNSANDLVLWRRQQNKIELSPKEKSIANNSSQTFRGSQLSSGTDIIYSNQNLQDESFYHRPTLETHENTGADYTNNYTFTAEKVDVHTKYTNDHKIRIIRRLKVDLDVREIVSRCVNVSDGNYSKQELRNINTSDIYNSQAKTSGISKESQTISKINELNENKVEILTIRNAQFNIKPESPATEEDTESKVTCMLGKIQKNHDDDEIAQRENRKPGANATRKEENIRMIEMVQQENNAKSKSSNTEDTKAQPDETRTPENLQQSREVSTQLEHKKPDDDVARKENSIGNILQKYAQIIRNNKNSDIQNTPNLPKRETINIKPTPFKTTRPFKITEIQNLNVPLPSFCQNIQPSSAREDQAEIVKTVIANRIQTPLANMPVVENLSEKPLDHTDLTPCQSPVHLLEHSLEISEGDLSIDQSMFNPKTLLQNMGRDDMDLEIIPPPPEFCNDDYGLPEIYDNEDLKSQIYSDELNQALGGRHNTSVLEDVFPDTSNLTPSKEIETWTLDRDNEFDKSFKYTTPTQSYTVMRRKLFQSFPSQGSQDGSSRQGRLNQFKFNSKNKFNL